MERPCAAIGRRHSGHFPQTNKTDSLAHSLTNSANNHPGEKAPSGHIYSAMNAKKIAHNHTHSTNMLGIEYYAMGRSKAALMEPFAFPK